MQERERPLERSEVTDKAKEKKIIIRDIEIELYRELADCAPFFKFSFLQNGPDDERLVVVAAVAACFTVSTEARIPSFALPGKALESSRLRVYAQRYPV